MEQEQLQETLLNKIRKIAIDFAYNNFSELKANNIQLNIQDCNVKPIIQRQRVVGPGEAIDPILTGEEWEVYIPVNASPQCLMITVCRYHDGSLEVTEYR